MIFSVVYLLTRRMLGCLMVLARHVVSKDAEILVLQHENAVLRRRADRVRYQPAGRLWLAALSRLIPPWSPPRATRTRGSSPPSLWMLSLLALKLTATTGSIP